MTISQPTLATLPATWTDRYLAMLGVERAAPSLEALSELSRAHLNAVLFGTVQSVLRKRATPEGPVPPLDLAAMLHDWERRTGSGVCFEAAAMVHQLLTSLGYQAYVVLASIMRPGGHQAVVVELDGRRWMVDVGNGAPFFDPIPLDEVSEVHHVGLSYRFHPGDEPHIWVQDRLIDGAWQPFCTYDLRHASAADREASYQRHHVLSESWVASTVRLIRCGASEVSVLNEGVLTRFTDAGKTVETIEDPAAYRRLAADQFDAPNLPLDEVRAAVDSFKAATQEASANA